MSPSSIPADAWNADIESWSAAYKRTFKGCQVVPGGDPLKFFQSLTKMQRGEVDFDQMTCPSGIGRVISVPLQKLDKCGRCEKTTSLRLCGSCASAIYCSRKCQRFAWKDHKRFCTQTQQVNLKTFYPFIAYMIDSIRRISSTQNDSTPPPSTDPFIMYLSERLGHRPPSWTPDSMSLHPALRHRILKAPTPGARRATETEHLLHHTVVLGEKHDLQINRTIPNAQKLAHWWRGRAHLPAMQMYTHVTRESYILEITLAVSLVLLSEIYSTHMTKITDGVGEVK